MSTNRFANHRYPESSGTCSPDAAVEPMVWNATRSRHASPRIVWTLADSRESTRLSVGAAGAELDGGRTGGALRQSTDVAIDACSRVEDIEPGTRGSEATRVHLHAAGGVHSRVLRCRSQA